MFRSEAAHHEIYIGSLPRVIQPSRTIHLPIATAKDEYVGSPAAQACLIKDSSKVVRSNCPFESMQDHEARGEGVFRRYGVEPANFDLVRVGCSPTLQSCWNARYAPEELPPQGLEVGARYPPCGGIGKFADTIHVSVRQDGLGKPFNYIRLYAMDVQVFGTKKSAETRKALRFFAERRLKTHFVDLQERAAARGELMRYVQKFGAAALVDEQSRRFAELGLRTARYGDERWLEILVTEPMILKMPLVRHGNALTIGAAETTWKSWFA